MTKREKVIAYWTLAVIIFAVVFNFILFPFLREYGTINSDIYSYRKRLIKNLELLNKKDFLQERFSKFPSLAKLPEEDADRAQDTVVGILKELEGFSNSAGIHIVDLRPEAGTSRAGKREVIFSLKTEGPMEAYLKFIHTVENSFSLLKIKRFSLGVKTNSSSLEGLFSISYYL